VEAGDGLTGGGNNGDVTLNVGAGTGIDVDTDRISLSPEYREGSVYDGRFVNEGEPDTIHPEMIVPNAVTTEKIATEAVTVEKIAPEAVTVEKIASEAVATEKIAAEAVTTEKIATEAVTVEKIAAEAVTTEKIAAEAVTTEKIAPEAVTVEKIGEDIISSIDGVSNDGGNIDLIAGAGITITSDDTNNTITISGTGGGGGDNLGNHTATQNLNLNSNWLSGDGDPEGIFVDTDGKVGIGTEEPEFKLTLNNGGILGTGTLGEGTLLTTSDAGPRLIWYPRKGAFRAGGVETDEWIDENIGLYSTALGYRTTASASYSTALGYETTASGNFSTALGYHTTAEGHYSTAFGRETTASGQYSTALGSRTTASGRFSMALGYLTQAESFCETVIGRWDTDYDPQSDTTWIPTDRLFVIGNGTNPTSRSDAMVVLKNGNVGFGTSTPEFKLTLNNGGILARGTLGEGALLTTGDAGPQLIWYPRKGAFRAGGVETDEWIDENIGLYSTALGYRTTASAPYSTALGYRTRASGEYSFAVGAGAATGEEARCAIAMGLNTTVSGQHSAAIGGYLNEVSGDYSIAIGPKITVTGDHSVAISLNDDPLTLSWSSVMAIMGGRVGIDTTEPQYDLHVNGSAGKPGGGMWSNPSDLRLKDIQGSYEKGLAEIVRLNPVRFRYKINNPRGLPSDIDQIGLIGQEVEKVFPEAVSRNTDGYLDFNMHAVNVAMINAIKELKAENEKLKARIEELERKNKTH
jgi:hypothetical protein